MKPENILVGEKDAIKLVDLGLSAKVSSKAMLTDFCGSPGFFAPEMITEDSYNGFSSDVWSIGCVMMEMILGHDFFTNVWMVRRRVSLQAACATTLLLHIYIMCIYGLCVCY